MSVPRITLDAMRVLDDSEPLVPYQCSDCECVNTTNLLVGDGNTPICGCCLADCPDVHGPDGRRPEHYQYEAQWSDEDCEFVGLSAEFPSLSFLAPTPYKALAGIKSLVADALHDMAQAGETPPRRRIDLNRTQAARHCYERHPSVIPIGGSSVSPFVCCATTTSTVP